jgi:hypothetical protein
MKEREGKEVEMPATIRLRLVLVNPTLEERGGKELEISASLRSV